MFFKRNNSVVYSYDSEYRGSKIIIGIDSSKSNTGIVIGSPSGKVYNDYEIDGSGSENNVFSVARESRKALRRLLDGAEIVGVGLEDIITKKDKNSFSPGLNVHQSRAAITHIFDSYIIMFQDYFDIMPDLINNEAWKHAILPKEFNHKGEKGSKLYYDTCFPGSRWANRKDDVTDAYCIYQFEVKQCKCDVSYTVNVPTLYRGDFDWAFYPLSILSELDSTVRKFEFNKVLSIEQITNSIVSSLSKDEDMAYCIVPIEYVGLDILYSDKLVVPFPKGVKELVLVVAKGD